MTNPQPLTTNMLALIALFEGSARGQINVWDEQYLSLGTLHYAVGQGSGARFLQRVYQLDPAGTLACLGKDFTAAIKAGVPAIKAFCRTRVWQTGTRWNGAFVALSRLPAYQQADMELAQPYLDAAQRVARRYGLTSERGLAWALDRCVQQGGSLRSHVEFVFKMLQPGLREDEVMDALSRAYAATANPKYRNVVLARSLTVAHGNNLRSKYPGSVSLERQYGISGTRPWNPANAPAPAAPTGLRVFLEDPAGRNILWDGDQSDVYGGVPLKNAWLTEVRDTLKRGSRTALRGIYVTVFDDGALLLERD
ncbi:glycosyl hydrolase [Deinococcus sp. UR1]|uniref:glycosyl hydrolase n=1 Tax=Deinococcus sp. UR1 TaxID=1704277 RepID=UPI000C18FFEA|nr:glycosyl hydrolase [Deinococcus sp. UR1]PIG96882.1 glycosyl hydrolase [Deinococcus sp. UR1]